MSANNIEKKQDPSGIARFLPIAGWLPQYDRSWLKGDIIAGLSVWALMGQPHWVMPP